MSNRELRAAQEIADHRLGAITLLRKIDNFFYPPDTELPDEAALIVEIHKFLAGTIQHEVSCDAYGIGGSPRDKPCTCSASDGDSNG